MSIALIFNPGSNSLKFELIETSGDQRVASQARTIASAALDGIGKDTKLSVYDVRGNGRDILSEQGSDAKDMSAAVHGALEWLRSEICRLMESRPMRRSGDR